MAMVYQLSVVQEEIIRKGPWLEEEVERLATFVTLMGERRWDSIAKVPGLRRSGKSCRLRWMNYLRPDLKHGQMNAEEERIILKLQHRWGNRWSKIARKLPGRTDNEIKSYWRTHLRKKTQIEEQEKDKAENDAPTDCLGQRDVVDSEKIMWTEHDGCAQDIMRPSEHSLDVSGPPVYVLQNKQFMSCLLLILLLQQLFSQYWLVLQKLSHQILHGYVNVRSVIFIDVPSLLYLYDNTELGEVVWVCFVYFYVVFC